MGNIGKPRTLHQKWKFTVEIDQFTSAAFNKCSSIEFEVAKVEYSEGGAIIPIKEPGRATVSDVTLDRGVGLDNEMHAWALECVNFSANGGAVPQDLKRNVELVQRLRDGTEAKRWVLYNAWPQKYVAGEWDNDADEVTVEQLVLCYDFPELVTN